MSADTLRVIAGLFLIAHGLIHFSLTTVPVPQPGALRTPYWPSFRRADVDRTWLASRLGLPESAVRMLGTLLWIGILAGFSLAGLGLLGVPGLNNIWTIMAAAGSVLSILMLIFYWHPWLVLGVVIDLAILAGIYLNVPAALFPGQ